MGLFGIAWHCPNRQPVHIYVKGDPLFTSQPSEQTFPLKTSPLFQTQNLTLAIQCVLLQCRYQICQNMIKTWCLPSLEPF